MKAKFLFFALVALVASAFASAPLSALPYTYAGRVLNFMGQSAGDADVVVRVYNQSGRLLAKTAVFASDATPYNYRLNVPVAVTPADGCAVKGERLVFEVTEYNGAGQVAAIHRTLVSDADATVGPAGGVCRVDLVLAADSDGDGVPDKYVDAISGYLAEAGVATFDPNADYDGDGLSNYAEYRAGTNPFSKDDYFAVRAAAALAEMDEGDFFAITFYANPGRTYSVKATASLSPGSEWIHSSFKESPSGTAADLYYVTQPATSLYSGGGTKTIYLPKVDKSGGFYRLNVE